MTFDLSILPEYAAAAFIVFARIATMVALLPALSERAIPVRLRLSAALMLTFVFLPVATPLITVRLDLPSLAMAVLGEIAVGAVLGIVGRFAIASLQSAGTIIANQLGLAFVSALDPTQGQQGALVGSFLSMLGITLIFATDLHHMVIAALGDSYTLFRPLTLPPAGDAADMAVRLLAASFVVSVQISAPFLVFGLVFNIGLGILSKLMPQMQVFFVAMPATILVGLVILLLLLSAMMAVFLGYVESALGELVVR